jgi:hypothetical protein
MSDSHSSASEPKGGLFSFLKRNKGEEAEPEHGPLDPDLPRNLVPYSTDHGPLFNLRVKYRGVYDLDGLYKFMSGWLRKRRYEFHETLYKNKPPEVEIRWRAERKKTGYIMEILTVYFHMWGEYDVEVVQNGKKKKMANARMIITLDGNIVAPHPDIFEQPRWTANNVERRLLRIFNNWFMKNELNSIYWDTLYYEMNQFQGAIKDYLGMSAGGNVY